MVDDRGTTFGSGALWFATGLVLSLGGVSLPSIGLFLLALGAALLVLALVRVRLAGSPFLLLGAALPLLLVAWLHRRGPGEHCWRTESAGGCSEYLDPWPFLVAGLVLLLVGGALVAAARARDRAAGQPLPTVSREHSGAS